MLGPVITALTRHRVSADVIMLAFILCGVWATTQLTVRFFPPFESNTIITTVVMANATTADIEEAVVVPLENALRNVPDFKKIYSYSRENSGTVVLEFPDGVAIDKAIEDVKAEVERVSLPTAAEAPNVATAKFSVQVSRLTIVGAAADELRALARRMEADFGAQGIGKVSVIGLPTEEIEVLVDQRKLIELNLTLAQVGEAIRGQNFNASIGSITELGNERKVRTDAKSADFTALAELPINATPNGALIHLRDIARLQRKQVSDQVTLLYNGEPAVMLLINTTGTGNLLETAEQLNAWADRQRAQLPPSVRIIAHDEEWRNVQSRLDLLVTNGSSGMLLVLLVLFLFLSPSVAFWVAAGIPVAMLGTLFIFYHAGGTINMISMFALIMAVGIVVDDAIVVGENAQFRVSRGDPPMRAVTAAARKMFTPVFASSFTTIAAFLPLFLVSGPIGSIIFDIPLIIVCILLAALVECFLVLPGHLYRSFAKRATATPSFLRRTLDRGVDNFRERFFRPFVTLAVRHATATIATCVMILAFSVSLLANGFVNYRFFPGAEGNRLYGNVAFGSGTPRARVEDYVRYMLDTLNAVDAELDPEMQLVAHASAFTGQGDEFSPPADHKARILVELVDVDLRTVTVAEFAEAWRAQLDEVPGIIQLNVRGESGGPPGRDIEIRLTANDVSQIKEAAQQVKAALTGIPGVSSVSDDTPFGKEEVVFTLTPLGRSLNLDIADVAGQLRHALDGFAVQSFTEGVDEVDLYVRMDNFDADLIGTLYLRVPNGDFAPLRDIVTWRIEQGFDQILHQFGQPAIVVSGDLDPEAPTTVNAVLAEMEEGVLAQLYENDGVAHSFEGKNADEQQTAKDMMTGMVLAVVLIFIILTWVFNSWTMPLVVMLTMPLGVIGTILGHWVMGLSMSILSFFGIFTLMGILVNNSIVLVDCFKEFGVDNRHGEEYDRAIVEAACLRLRAVLLTSLTTIGGLLPLMFENSLQAKFLLPMAVSICFGLAFASVLILLFTPACMSLHGAWGRFLSRRLSFRNGSRRLAVPQA